MNSGLKTYSQLRAALLERYERPPVCVPRARLEEHLAERVFQPLEVLLQRVDRLEQIANRLVTDASPTAADKAQIVSEFQDTLERILVDYQSDLLNVPNETVQDVTTP